MDNRVTNLFLQESTMEDSFIYKSFNASNGLIEKMVKYIKTSVLLDTSYFEEQYSQIKKTGISPLSTKVLDAYNNGQIELLYSRETKIGNSIPFIIRKNEKGNIVATIFIASFSTIDKNSNLTIPVKQLYALMETAYVALQMQLNPTKIQRNLGTMKLCSSIYTQMIVQILNKEYALTLDKTLYDQVTYIVTRFFLTNVWEYPNKELIESYAKSDLKYIEGFDLDLTVQGYDNAGITDFNTLIQYLSTLSPRMKELNTRYFIERYINTYHGSSILSIDYLPYVFFVIINTLLSSFLISHRALNDIIKNTRGINKFYPELLKLV